MVKVREIWSSIPTQAGLHRATCTEPCPCGFWVSPRRESPQLSWQPVPFLACGGECHNRGMMQEKKSFKYLQKTSQLCGSSYNCLLETQEKMSLFKVMIFVALTCNFWHCGDGTKLNLSPPRWALLLQNHRLSLMGKYFILVVMYSQFFYLCKCLLCLLKIFV